MENKSFCTKCGSELNENVKFCSQCGSEVTKEEPKHEEEIVVEPPKKRGRPRRIIKDVEESIMLTENEELTKEAEAIIEKEKTEREEFLKNNDVPLKNMEPTPIEIKEKNDDYKKWLYPIISSVLTFIICLGAFGLFYEYYLKNLVIETTKREVTVTDKGIAEAVKKVYDSVVVVESYNNNQLYATGTGFVYKTDDKHGYILTNDHVISNATDIKVVFTNNKKEEVEVVGTDSYSDVAVLKVSKEAVIAIAEMGSSEELEVGDTAFAVGAPLDSATYAWTVTRGVISGKNRAVEVTGSNGYASTVMEVLQTDTAINSGNSGGPLCNSNGQVIGITNMKLASSTIEGMGFAIPIETALKYAEKFIKGEKITYPYIGVSIYDATANRFSTEIIGVFVESVQKDSPAHKGGLKSGDKILKVNDTEIPNSTYFRFELYKYEIGEKITITVERNGQEKELEVTLGSSNPEL